MNRFWLASIAACALCAPAFASDAPTDAPTNTAIAAIKPTLNEIINQTNFIVADQCSGTLVSIKYKVVLSNDHCLEGYVEKVTKNEEGSDGAFEDRTREVFKDMELKQKVYSGFDPVGTASLQAKILFHSKKFDLALLKIKADTIPQTIYSHVLPESGSVHRGDKVYAVGNPYMLDANLNEGVISSVTRTLKWDDPAGGTVDVHYYGVDAGVNPGNSGGSLYNADFDLIGVPAAHIRDSTGVGFAIPAESIREFLKDHCYADIYDDKAKSHDECVKAKFDKANDARVKAGKPALDAPKSWDDSVDSHSSAPVSQTVVHSDIEKSVAPAPVVAPAPAAPIGARPITGLLADWINELLYTK